MPDLLFIYGTLHPDRAPAAISETARLLKHFGPATVQARSYDLGEYPGAVLTDDPSATLPGELFILPEDPTVLDRLDAYEGFHPADPAASLFLRQRTQATLPDGSLIDCWLYTYNRPLS